MPGAPPTGRSLEQASLGFGLTLWAALAAGCFSPHLADGQYACGPEPDRSCPAGLSCQGGLCRSGGALPDAGPPRDMPTDSSDLDVPDQASDGSSPPDQVVVGDRPVTPDKPVAPDVAPDVALDQQPDADLGPPDVGQDVAVVPVNLLVNGSFDESDADISPWYVNTVAPGSGYAELETVDPADGPQAVRVTVDTADPLNWHVQLAQSGLAMPAGRYAVSFYARASETRPIVVAVQQDHDPYVTYSYDTLTIGLEWQKFGLEADVTADDSCFLGFDLGDITGTVWIDGVTLAPLP
jgi:hypothetical protein